MNAVINFWNVCSWRTIWPRCSYHLYYKQLTLEEFSVLRQLCLFPCVTISSQARIPEWVAIPFSRGSSQCRDQAWSCVWSCDSHSIIMELQVSLWTKSQTAEESCAESWRKAESFKPSGRPPTPHHCRVHNVDEFSCYGGWKPPSTHWGWSTEIK